MRALRFAARRPAALGREFAHIFFTALKGRSSTKTANRFFHQKAQTSKVRHFGRGKLLLSWFIRAIK
jgi:hypothetical protein